MACAGTSRPCDINQLHGCKNGACCQYPNNEPRCFCRLGYRGVECAESDSLRASTEEMNSKGTLVFGIFLGLLALILVAIVVYIVFRLMRRRRVQVVIIEDDGEPCSPLITDADIIENEAMDSVVIVRNHTARSHVRYSTASYCCDPSHRETGQFPLSPVSTGHPCQYMKQTSTYQGQHSALLSHDEEDEGEEVIRTKAVEAITQF